MDSSLLSVKSFCSYVVSNWCQTNPTMPKSDSISRLLLVQRFHCREFVDTVIFSRYLLASP